jgi:hypothetical protein
MIAKKAGLVVAWSAAGLLLCGCGFLFPMFGSRTCDQGCSSTVLAVGKVVTDNLGSLNPDDVQVLGDVAEQVTGVKIPAVTNQQGAAVVSFLHANGIKDVETLQAKIEEAETNPESIVIPPDVQAVLEAIAADPGAWADLAIQLGL